MKKLLSIVLALTMILSINAFALSNVEFAVSGNKYAAVGSGMEASLTKSGSKLTVTVYLVGELNKLTGVTAGLKAVKTALTLDSVTIASEFTAEKADWTATPKNVTMGNNNMCGYVTNAKTLTDYLNVAAGSRLKFMEAVYTIVDTDITADNYSDYLSFLIQSPAKTVLTFDSANPLYPNDATYSSLFEINASSLDAFNLSINTPANGITGISATQVAGGQSVGVTAIPAVGYYISSVMAGTANITSSFDAYRGGTIQYTPTANTDITVTFAEIESVSSDVTTSTGMTGVDALTLPEVFRGKATNEATDDVSIAFGQIAPNAVKTIKGYGIYLTYADGRDVTTAAPSIGPKFAAKTISADNQFGIIFEQIKAGNYFAQTYIEYTDGSTVFGIKVPFTVAE